MHTNRIPRDGERGNAMVIALLILLVLTGVGMSYVLQTKTETQIAGNGVRWSQALYNADAGISEGLARMANMSDTTNYVGEPKNTVNPGWGVYIVDAAGSSALDPELAELESDGLDNDRDGLVDESGEQYPEVLTRQTGSNTIPYPWVRVEYVMDDSNRVVRFGDHDTDMTTPQTFNLVEGAPVIRVSAEGDRGNALRRVEIEAAKPAINVPRAAIYSEDDEFKFNGTQFYISGQDWDPATDTVVPGSAEVPGIITTENPDNIKGELKTNQQNNVDGSGGEPSVTNSPVDLDLRKLFDEYAGYADRTLPAATYSNVTWGGYDDYEITVIQGDLHGSGSVVGGGILLVDGNMSCSGQMLWYGLVVVLGDMDFTGGGSGIHIFGSLLVEGNVSQQVVSGNADIKYSSEALSRLNNLGSYTAISWLEF